MMTHEIKPEDVLGPDSVEAAMDAEIDKNQKCNP